MTWEWFQCILLWFQTPIHTTTTTTTTNAEHFSSSDTFTSMCVQKRELWSVLSPSALTILHCESVKDTYPHMNQGEIIDTHSVLEVTGFRDAVTLTCCPRQPCCVLSADEIAAQIQIHQQGLPFAQEHLASRTGNGRISDYSSGTPSELPCKKWLRHGVLKNKLLKSTEDLQSKCGIQSRMQERGVLRRQQHP